MADLNPYYDFRRRLVDALVLDLIGPAGGERETIDDPPITRYAAGILYPRASDPIDPSLDVDTPDENEETAASDPPVALANRRYPSSMGMTFAVDSKAADTIRVRMGAGRYIHTNARSDAAEEAVHADAISTLPDDPGVWVREPVDIPLRDLTVTRPEPNGYIHLTEGLDLFHRIRRADAHGVVPVTLVLMNRQTAGTAVLERDGQSFFQPFIEVTAPGVPNGAFVERPNRAAIGSDEDVQMNRLLYRHAREFGVGHGCSVRWDIAGDRPDRAVRIATTFGPEYELELADSNPGIRSVALGMRYLAEKPRAKVCSGLQELCDGYEEWIRDRRVESSELAADLTPIARVHLERCEEALGRMRKGIRILEDDDRAWAAFRLANKAMLQQRARTEWLRRGKPTQEPVEDEGVRWRPFQLAFFLLCLGGIADPESPDRNLADLLWFPTGGGKTEAYLGLIAFTVFLRRLRRKEGGGVTALMRYTLRLLTIQQFERAALLICCCEAIRASRADLGTDPISIGLWVGQGATPNSRDDTRTALNKIRTGVTPAEGNPIQLHSCPWCGAPLDHRNYWLSKHPEKLVISCKQTDCRYQAGIPVYLVDEDVYDYRPTLIIATVDKFASLPWRERTADLFNLPSAGRPEGRRPELIIQDELHLISGPLGTLVGLYETAVDLLCTQDGVRPKVIASTATIRRAQDQARGLFNREVRQFPPPGLDARDSYFAVQAPAAERGTRLYIGLTAPGASHTTLLVRAYGALLQKADEIPAPPEVKDPYWTLVGYFNSLRVLGGARMQVQDDVTDRMGLLARQSGSNEPRCIDERIELTSREPSGDIPRHLKAMAVTLPARNALDVILATNMISVGVDIDRLGLMVVMGQPQGTSEYIQATSRVGRRLPGLVVVLFNAARSRDRSHYESFVAYHSALYRQVEATSVTPFSARARDRGLHAVVVGLARLLVPVLRPNNAAGKILTERSALEVLNSTILSRIASAAPEELEAARSQLDQLLDQWTQRAEVGADGLVYSDRHDPARSLLIDASQDSPTPDGDEYFATLWSLRDVDTESPLRLTM